MSTSTNLGLPYLDAAQAQKHVTHNEALRILDTLLHLAVLDRDLAAPPGSPSDGQRWIVAASPTGAWAGHATHVAAWQDGAWQFSAPKTGWAAFVVDEGTLVVWNGTAWDDFFSTVTSIQNLARLGVGTTADATNPFSAKLNNALWVAKTVAEGGDGNLRYKFSKESAAKTLTFLFQDNFSGRAEIGLAGDDDFHFKVSSDGSSWTDAFLLKASSGQAQFQPTTDASSTTTGAAVFAGGVGIAKTLYVGTAAYVPTGTAGSPTLAVAGDTGTGLWSPASSSLAWSLGGSEAMRLTATGLGIGGTATKKLDVFGTARISGDVSLTGATASTSSTTGALAVAGGLGVAGAIYAGDTINVATGKSFRINGAQLATGITASNNYFFGPSGNLAATGTNNSGLAASALVAVTSGNYNMAVGDSSLFTLTSASYNVAIGFAALFTNNGNYNVGIGSQAGYSLSSGTYNVAIGYQAGYYASTGANNVLIGHHAGLFDGASASGGAIATDGNIVIGSSGCMIYDKTLANQLNIGNLIFGSGLATNNAMSTGNIGIGVSVWGTAAANVIGIKNGTAPSSSPAGMGQLYVESGALKYRGSSGTVTTLGNA